MSTILVTGGNGNLARLLIEQLAEQGNSVICLDIGEPPPEGKVASVDYRVSDIRDDDFLDTLISERQPDSIIHLASLLSGSSEIDRSAAWEINATACFKLYELCLKHGVQRFVFPGTAASYGKGLPATLPEDFPQWPENLYGVTKVACERMGYYYRKRHGLDFRCLRLPMVLSPWAPANALTAYASSAYRAAAAGEAFVFPVSKNNGMSTIFVNDVVKSFIQLSGAPAESIKQPAYNLHGFLPTAIEIAQSISALVPNFEYRFEPAPEVETLISSWPSIIDDAPARKDWGWAPDHDLKAASAKMLQLLRKE